MIESRKAEMPEGSYVTSLLNGAPDAVLRKIGEEACELVLAAKNNDSENIVHETADLIFHTLVLLGSHGIKLEDVYDELRKRFKE